MLLTSVATKSFRDRIGGAAIGGAALGILAMVMLVLVDGLSGVQSVFDEMPDDLVEFMGGGIGGGNYAMSEFYGLIAPIVMLVLAINGGSAALAGEEHDRTAGLLLTMPISRRKVVVSKAFGLVVHLGIASALIAVGTVAGTSATSDDFGVSGIIAASLQLFVFALAFGMAALAISVASGSMMIAVAATAAVAFIGRLASGILPLIDGADGYAKVSPWHYYSGTDPLVTGVAGGHLLVLGLASAALFAVAWISVEARDIQSSGGGMHLDLASLRRVLQPRVSSVFSKTLSEQTGLLMVAGYGLLGSGVGVCLLYEPLRGVLDAFQESMPAGVAGFIGTSDIGSLTGWINAEMLSTIAPALLIAVAVRVGVGAVAGEEGSRTLGLLFALPIRRSRIVVEKAMALAAVLVVLSILMAVGLIVGSALTGLDLEVGNVIAASAHLGLLGIVFGAVASAVGAATDRKTAAGVAGGLAVVGYLVVGLAPLVDSLRGLAKLSPWYFATAAEPLDNGVDISHLVVLAALTVVGFGAAVVLTDRRDVNA